MKNFKINNYLSLKLEGNSTVIYVKGKRFKQCKYLLLDIPVEKITSLDEIESIDEAADKLDHSQEPLIGRESRIPPETEFWGHCSNLQVWAENNYDTRLLHSNLSFPLLKRLRNEGDPKARKVFRDEIVKRIESGYVPVITYLLIEGYLKYLNKEQRDVVLNLLKRVVYNFKLEEKKSSCITIWNNIGWIYNLSYKYDKSIKAYKNAIKIDPMNQTSWNNLGISYNEKGEYNKALEAFKKAYEINCKQKYYLNNLGWAYCNLGEYDKAIEACKKAIDMDPRYSNPWNHLGYALHKKGEHNKAIGLIKKSIFLKPNYSRAFYYLAKIYFFLERYDEALYACDQCMETIRSTIDIYYKSSFNVKECVELRKKISKLLQKKTKYYT